MPPLPRQCHRIFLAALLLAAAHTAFAGEAFTESFDSNSGKTWDLANRSVTFTPSGNGSYTAASAATTAFGTSTAGAAAVSLTDDSSATVALTGGKTFPFFGVSYSALYVGSNGYLTFDSSDTTYSADVATHFSKKRIALLMRDLNPGSGGSTVSSIQLADRIAITFSVVKYNGSALNIFQVELFFSGVIRITWLATPDGTGSIVGLSAGGGTPAAFVYPGSDFSTYSSAPLNPPGSPSATPLSMSSIRVAWADTNSDETGYKVERAATANGTWTSVATTSANATSYTDAGLAYATTYFYRIAATRAGTDSTYSATVSATTQADTVPPAIASAAAVSASQVLVTFNEAVDAATANASANYSIPGTTVLSAVRQADPSTVLLTVTTMPPGGFTLSVSNVRDANGNAISGTAPATASFTYPAVSGVVQGTDITEANYGRDVEDFWATHKYNPASPNYNPTVSVRPGGYLDATVDGTGFGGPIVPWITQAVAENKTLRLPPGSRFTSGPNTNLAGFRANEEGDVIYKSNVHIVCESSTNKAKIVGMLRFMNNSDWSVSYNDNATVYDQRHNYYFKNISFDGGADYSLPTVEGNGVWFTLQILSVHDILFDGCEFVNCCKYNRGLHDGNVRTVANVKNIWFLNCYFNGGVYSNCLDGDQDVGLVNCRVGGTNWTGSGGNFLFFANDDDSYDINGDNKLEWNESLITDYAVVANCTWDAAPANPMDLAISFHGAHCLALNNTINREVSVFCEIDSRWSYANPGSYYPCFGNVVKGNSVQKVRTSFVWIRDNQPGPKPGIPAHLGIYRVSDNTVTTALADNLWYNESVQTDGRDNPLAVPAVFGPNYIWNNTSANRTYSLTGAYPANDTTPPAAPTNLHTTHVGTMGVTLAWTAPADADVYRYDVYRKDAIDNEFRFVGYSLAPGTSYGDGHRIGASLYLIHNGTGLIEPGQTYQYYVCAVDGTGANDGLPSNTITVTTAAAAATTANVTMSQGASWPEAPSNTDAGQTATRTPMLGYFAQLGASQAHGNSTAAALDVLFDGAGQDAVNQDSKSFYHKEGGDFVFTMDLGLSERVDKINVFSWAADCRRWQYYAVYASSNATAPSAMGDLEANGWRYVAWVDTSNAPGAGEKNFSKITGIGMARHLCFALRSGRKEFNVAGQTVGQQKPALYGEIDVFATDTSHPTTPPTDPSALAVSGTTLNSITVGWSDNSDNESGFQIERSTDNSTWAQVGLAAENATAFTDTTTAAGDLYYYRVRATNIIGDSAYTGTASGTAQTATVPGNILSNPSFESGTATTPSNWGSQTFMTRDTTFARSGSASMKLTGGNSTTVYTRYPFPSVTANLTASTTYEFTAWVRGNSTLTAGHGIRLFAMAPAAAGSTIFQTGFVTATSTAWTQVKLSFTTPATAADGWGFRIYPYLSDIETVWVDDVSVAIVNAPPSDISLSTPSFTENSAIGTTVGNLTATDPTAGDIHSFALVSGTGSTDNALFSLTGNELKLASATIGSASKPTCSIRVRATDAGGLTFEKALTITVAQANQPPSDISLSYAAVDENSAAGTTVGSLTATDANAGDSHTFTLVAGAGATDNALFAVEGNTLKVVGGLDYEAKPTCSVRIRATDASGAAFEKAFAITIANLPETPYELWAQSKFGTGWANPALAGGAVVGPDGISNLLRYALNLPDVVTGQQGMPAVASEGGNVTFTYQVDTSKTDITCSPESSADLSTWTPVTTKVLLKTVGSIETWKASVAPGANNRTFFRLKVAR